MDCLRLYAAPEVSWRQSSISLTEVRWKYEVTFYDLRLWFQSECRLTWFRGSGAPIDECSDPGRSHLCVAGFLCQPSQIDVRLLSLALDEQLRASQACLRD